MNTKERAQSMQAVNVISDGFESSFLSKELERHVQTCPSYELTPLFLYLLAKHQPVLEAGCGSGRWLHFFKQHGINAVGIDWSQALQERSRAYDPTVQFDIGDLRELPYPDGVFGAVIALGSPEHVIEGPKRILQELHRVLRPGGVGIISVPYYSLVRRFVWVLKKEALRKVKCNPFLARFTGRGPIAAGNTESSSAMKAKRYRRDIYMDLDERGYFYQYVFTKSQFAEELRGAGFCVDRLFPCVRDGGILANFGKLAGTSDRFTYEVRFTVLGRILSKVLSTNATGHMLCGVVHK